MWGNGGEAGTGPGNAGGARWGLPWELGPSGGGGVGRFWGEIHGVGGFVDKKGVLGEREAAGEKGTGGDKNK